MKKLLVALVLCLLGVSVEAGLIHDGTIYRTGGGEVGTQYDSSHVETTVDHFYFTVNTSSTIEIDVLSWEGLPSGSHYLDPAVPTDLNGDGEIAYLDTYIYVFHNDGSLDVGDLVVSNDDTDDYGSDGTIRRVDSHLSEFLSAGDYILAVGAYILDVQEAVAGHNSTSRGPATNLEPYPSVATVHDHGDYRVTFIGDVVPEPATICLLGLGCLLLRRRKSS